ncbi:hypothetical protein GA0116948_101295 [Chitinophaga costaii]|uniref:Uncharacterized protein n=1 Tax=Chitinophaga costaii TaxID=1335309 RepID=A0A1C3Z9I6_9BACT|nr:hypothetical protein GA0116948_101295 [Chitinophaga costaii]
MHSKKPSNWQMLKMKKPPKNGRLSFYPIPMKYNVVMGFMNDKF